MPKKPKAPRTRDPIASDLRTPKYRKRVAKSGEERVEQQDVWSKKAKHKKQSLEEFYQVGDKVDIIKGPLQKILHRAEEIASEKKGEEDRKTNKMDHGVVRDPSGPAGTIGITVDGEYHLIDEEDVKLILESAGEYEDLTEWSYAESVSGIRVLVSSEEQNILSKCATPVHKSELDDRDQEIARRMVSRGVLHRKRDDDGIYFVTDNKKLTRF